MSLPIEAYALIGDCHTAALVSRDGSIDWLCLPRFDSGACFAALLGESTHGRWLIAPAAAERRIRRNYRDGTLILHTEFETTEGAVRVIDWMPLSNERWDLLRIVEVVCAAVELVLPVAGHASSRTGLPQEIAWHMPHPTEPYCLPTTVRTFIPSPMSALGFVTIVAPSMSPSSTSTVDP